MSPSSKKQLSAVHVPILFLSVLAGVLVISTIREFKVGVSDASVTNAQHWQHIWTIVAFTAIALVFPAWVVVKGMANLAETKAALENQNNLLESLINSLPAPVFYKDENFVYQGCNKAFEHFIGMSRRELVGKSVYEIAPPELADIYQGADKALVEKNETQIYEAKVKYADGSEHDVMFHKAVFHKSDGALGGIVGVMFDISDSKNVEAEMRHMASHDGLTGLPNRTLLMDRLDQALARAHRGHDKVAVLFLDLDDFKPINDTLGHRHGDDVLKMMADRLNACLRETDTVARFGGDEFVVVMTDIKDAKDVKAMAENLNKALAQPFPIGGQEASLSASIGIALYPEHGQVSEKLLGLADDAMYQAKNKGKGQYQFSS